MRETDNTARNRGADEGAPQFQLDDDTLLATDKHRLYFKHPHPCVSGSAEWPVVSIQQVSSHATLQQPLVPTGFSGRLVVAQDREVDTVNSSPAVAGAYERLRATAAQVSFALKLRQGDLVIVNNNGAVHGRTAYQPAFDGEDRWCKCTSNPPLR